MKNPEHPDNGKDRPFAFDPGLSEKESSDLQTMIGGLQAARGCDPADPETIQKQIEAINKRMAYLTTMFLSMDRRMKPLYEIVRLLLEKSEVLNQRIDAIIDSLRTGDPL